MHLPEAMVGGRPGNTEPPMPANALKLHRTEGDAAATVIVDSDEGTPQPFSGWLELLQVL